MAENAGPANNAQQDVWEAIRPQSAIVSAEDIEFLTYIEGSEMVFKANVPLFGICAARMMIGRFTQVVEVIEVQNARELIAAHKLAHHPNIVDFYGKIENIVNGNKITIGYFTEYMEGGILLNEMNKRINEDFSSYSKMATRWSIQVARALAFCHSQNVIHRNIKAENMLLSQDHMTIKLFEFGLALPANLGEKQSYIGPVQYIFPPEIIGEEGQFRSFATSVDVYSYGIFLYAVFNRRDPWPNKSQGILSFRRQLMKGKRPECVIQLPDEIDVVMRRCWETNPDNRPSMEEVVMFLENYWERLYPEEPF